MEWFFNQNSHYFHTICQQILQEKGEGLQIIPPFTNSLIISTRLLWGEIQIMHHKHLKPIANSEMRFPDPQEIQNNIHIQA